MPIDRSEGQLQDRLEEVSRLLETHRVLESLTHRQEGPKRDLLEGLQHRQNLAELAKKVRGLHPADLAFIVEALPPDQRQLIWDQVAPPLRGQALVEMSDGVRQPLVDAMAHTDLVAALTGLDADDLRYLAEAVPAEVIAEVSATLDAGDRSLLHAAVSYPDDSVGAVMNHEVVSARDTQVLSEVVAELRARGSLPEQTDAIYVVDARNVLRGSLPIDVLLLGDPSVPVASLVNADVVTFAPEAEAAQAARSFERYDLVSAPVVDDRGKLIGRLTVDVVMDVLREEAQRRELSRAGLRGEEDMFASTWASARNRWPWLCVNLVTAFAASRVIGAFETTISQLVALAALMPMVASVGGNTGNQTVALVVRGLALDQISAAHGRRLVTKELTISVLNGVVWGGIMGLGAVLLYDSLSLGAVMMGAVLLNLVVAALAGIGVPLLLQRLGRDPVQGASVLLTFITDSLGFFLFLGLARVFLV
jgi:magnesium transporter